MSWFLGWCFLAAPILRGASLRVEGVGTGSTSAVPDRVPAKARVASAAEAGGEIAHPPLEIPGHGKFAIYIQGGIHHALWQV